MRVYIINGDSDYASVGVRLDTSTSKRLSGLWDGELQPEPGESYDLRLQNDASECGPPLLTDCPYAPGTNLLLSARAVQALASHLDGAGFLFPTHGLEGGYQLFLCQKHLPAIDLEASIVEIFPESGNIMGLRELVFRPEAIGTATLFRDPKLRWPFFATDAFVADVERHGLVGFRFRLAWSSDDGPRDVHRPIPIERIPGEFDRATRVRRDALRARVAAGEVSLPA